LKGGKLAGAIILLAVVYLLNQKVMFRAKG